MLPLSCSSDISVPKSWSKHIKSAVLQVISLAHYTQKLAFLLDQDSGSSSRRKRACGMSENVIESLKRPTGVAGASSSGKSRVNDRSTSNLTH